MIGEHLSSYSQLDSKQEFSAGIESFPNFVCDRYIAGNLAICIRAAREFRGTSCPILLA